MRWSDSPNTCAIESPPTQSRNGLTVVGRRSSGCGWVVVVTSEVVVISPANSPSPVVLVSSPTGTDTSGGGPGPVSPWPMASSNHSRGRSRRVKLAVACTGRITATASDRFQPYGRSWARW
jgi:hypothetical protein